jgi:hypothetical protein
MDIDDIDIFHYRPECHVPGCRGTAMYKVAAVWSDGTSRELKNYGLTCEAHKQRLLERARASSAGLRLAEGESVGTVRLYRMEAGRRDVELTPLDVPEAGA